MSEYMKVREQAKKELPDDYAGGKRDGFDAYYFGFDETGVKEIDNILKAVASAGAIAHHTQEWNDEGYVNGAGSDGVISPVDAIQEYANRAAKAFKEKER